LDFIFLYKGKVSVWCIARELTKGGDMEIILEINGEQLGEEADQADEVRRSIFKRFPSAIWERCGKGHKIVV